MPMHSAAGYKLGLSSCYCGCIVHSLGQWVAANYATPPTASDGQYATLNLITAARVSR